MKTKLLLPIILLLLAFIGNAQQKSKFAPQLDAVLKMFTTRNTEAAAGVLAENYTIARIFPGMEEQVLKEVLKQLPVFSGYIIKTEKPDKEGTRLTVDFTVKNDDDKKFPASFLILKDGKIQELNILENATVETKLPN